MNKRDAKLIAETITNEQLQEMFNVAKVSITDWKVPSTVNSGMSKGTAWNILAYSFDVTLTYHFLAKKNMVHEFGDYLPEELKPVKVKRVIKGEPHHEEPKFK